MSVDQNASMSGSGYPMFWWRSTIFLLVRLDNQDSRPLQLYGCSVGCHGRANVPVHGHLEPSMDHIDRTAQWRVIRAGILGNYVVQENYIASEHSQLRNWSHWIHQ